MDKTSRIVTGRPKPQAHPGQPSSGAGPALRVSELQLGCLPTAVACARAHASAVLHEWGLDMLADDTALVVSELITNAYQASVVLPGRPPIALRLRDGHRSVVIEAWDHSPADPGPSGHPDPEAEIGRGLAIVAALAHRWGVERLGYRCKVVWAEVGP